MKLLLSVILLLPLLLSLGCDGSKIIIAESVHASSGTDRLIRKENETEHSGGQISQELHSLVWQRLEDGIWQDHVTISKSEFQSNQRRSFWIHSIHSFDADSGIAIMKIAEDRTHSWRKWDINNNFEVETIRTCSTPDEPFEFKP